ncbi:hypothetical protein Phum_PHUM570090 [Pediculus humanus corporis]|uniref:Uncharacterized protein n=1 Tax=Pediculus humanus subsp. corporis TaxID=121224 RepID=E0W171_PEDHC|nr:uncharacterized protein Phum_PHUM570090 [Pediculus humanus corporis]EEB19377.1 hypothetical protein Phum_PHUM570090 [Pediculus humanus corporis]
MTILTRIGFWLCLTGSFPVSYTSPVSIQNGGYEGIVVGISEDVPNENCRTIIDNLMTLARSFAFSLPYSDYIFY